MKLNDILKSLKGAEVIGQGAEDEVTDVVIDSRRVTPGSLFIAMRGTQVDGHRFIPMAIEKGATAILCETVPDEQAAGVTYVKVADCEEAVGPVATAFNGNPTEKFKLVDRKSVV